jgi:hypothetical protein
MLLLLKVVVTSALVGLMSLAARAWGPAIGGLLMGLPWMTGPVLFLLGLERGDAFVTRASAGVLVGTIAIAAFVGTYATVARRASWPWSLGAACTAFLFTSAAVRMLGLGLLAGGAAAASTLIAAFLLIPRPEKVVMPRPLPWWDIPVRMLATACLVTVIALTADSLGPELSGIVATFPVIFTVVGAFTHATWGASAVTTLARGISLSLLSFTAFFVVVGLLAEPAGLIVSYLCAGGVALLVSAGLILSRRALMRR